MEQVGLVKQLDTVPGNETIDSQLPKYIISPGLLSVLKTEGAQGELFTKKEIMCYLRSYICNRMLFDNDKPTVIHCENDPLGDALGVKQFTINEAMALLSAKVRLATHPQKGHVLSPGLCNLIVGEKRRSSDREDEPSLIKRHCAEVFESSPSMARTSPFVFEITEAPDYDSSPETVFSYQGYETAVPIDIEELSSDDLLWFLETEEEYVSEIEYEVNSLTNSSAAEDKDDTNSESEVTDDVVVGDALLVCQNDSDVEFWADSDCDSTAATAVFDEHSTTESDTEIMDGLLMKQDKWKCLRCQAFNRPLLRFCHKCWHLRSDWLPDRYRRQLHRERVRQRRRRANFRRKGGDVKSEGDIGGVMEGTSTNDESSPPAVDVALASASSLCSICLSGPKNASIIHGKSGHQMCCYSCGKKLWAHNKPCPICRRTIQKVIKNYII